MKKIIVDLHILQGFATSNLNRDATGAPKMATLGGAPRYRWSSQAQKRQVRLGTEATLGEKYTTFRTKRSVDYIADALQARGVDADKATAAARNAIEHGLGIGLKEVAEDAEDEKDARKRLATNVLLFLGRDELDRITDLIHSNLEAFTAAKLAARTKKQLFKELDGSNSAGLALFGRFIAKQPELRIDGAVSVAHALSTHRATIDHDYYVAMDDLQPDDTTGADMIGTTDLGSATLYRYASVDVTDALKNLHGDRELTKLALLEFIHQFIVVRPASMLRATAPYTLPQFIGVNLSVDGAPINLVNAFEKPVTSSSGMMTPSIEALDAHHDAMKRAYGLDSRSLAYADGVELTSFQQAQGVSEILDAVAGFFDEATQADE